MKLVWTKANLPISILIRWGLSENSSHLVIVFDEKIVFNSELSGCQIHWYSTYLKTRTPVYQIEYKFPLEVEEQIYLNTINENDKRGYDLMALFYFIWRGFLFKYFKLPLPAKNKWSKNGKFLCTGLIGAMPSEFFPELKDIDLDMISPDTLFRILLNSNNPHRVTKP